MALFVRELQSLCIRSVFLPSGMAALRGIHQPLTINELWHGNLWWEAPVIISALIHKLPS